MVFDKIRSKLTPANAEMARTLGRNDDCHCGSGKKYKKCHLAEDEEAARKKHLETQIQAKPEEETKKDDKAQANKNWSPHSKSAGPVKGGGFFRSIFNRKTGGG